MNRRFSLAGVLIVVVAGAIFLWLHPEDAGGPLRPATTAAPAAPPAAARAAHYVLALSWEPAFCEGAAGRPECRAERAASPSARQFSLHGLWPDDDYCGVPASDIAADRAGRWGELPALALSATAAAALAAAMPGTRSQLDRHEWLKHGTCAGAAPELYFGRARQLLDRINLSPVGTLFASHIGRRLDGGEIRRAFDAAFGEGAGDRVRLACSEDGNRRLLGELTIGLRGDVMGSAGLAALIAGAAPTDPGCAGGIVDAAGRQ